MWQRFTERARKVVFYAQEAAQKYGQNGVGPEHLLLGLLREPESAAARVLEELKANPGRIESRVIDSIEKDKERPSVDMTLTREAKNVIDLAYEEARRLNNEYIGTEHLLLGLMRNEPKSRPLTGCGLDIDETREKVIAYQAKHRPQAPATPKPAPPPAPTANPIAKLHAAAFGALTHTGFSADFVALILLADRVPGVVSGLARLGLSPETTVAAIELEMLSGPPSSSGVELADFLAKGRDLTTIFAAIAGHPETCTSVALAKLGVTPDKLAVFDAGQSD